MTNKTKGTIIRVSSTILCVGAPLAATISQFPIWVGQGDKATMSGLFLLMACLCCIPFFRQIKEYFKSPAAWVMWIVFAVLAVIMRNIIDQMVMVGFVGAIANGIGAGLYKWGDYVKSKPDGALAPSTTEDNNGTN